MIPKYFFLGDTDCSRMFHYLDGSGSIKGYTNWQELHTAWEFQIICETFEKFMKLVIINKLLVEVDFHYPCTCT